MGYEIQEISFEDAAASIHQYEYALVYMVSELILKKTTELGDILWEECLEARFFSQDKEIHIFDDDGTKKAVKVVDAKEEEEDTYIQKYQLASKYRLGSTLCVKEYLSYDEDGQMKIELTRLAGIE